MEPTRRERVAAAIEGWEPAIALAAILGMILAGFAFEGFGNLEAVAVGFVFPVTVLLVAGLGLRNRRGLVLLLGIVICTAAFLGSEEQVSEVLFPHSPIARGNLRPGESLTLPIDAPSELRLAVHGGVRGTSADGTYHVDVVRGETEIRIRGRISRDVHRTRKGTRTNLHLTDRHEISIGGTGPIRVDLTDVAEMIKVPLLIEVRAAPVVGALARWALVVCLIGAALTEALSSRLGKKVQLAAAVGMALAFSEFVAAYYNPDSPLKFMVAALLFGLTAGGFGGWLAGALTTLLLGKPARSRASETTTDARAF